MVVVVVMMVRGASRTLVPLAVSANLVRLQLQKALDSLLVLRSALSGRVRGRSSRHGGMRIGCGVEESRSREKEEKEKPVADDN